MLHDNVDGVAAHRPPGNRTVARRHELLRYRCGLRTDPGADAWPFADTYAEPAP